ncbi:MAG: GvpL/GvpF family gas vesicle protein [Gemmatimonadaceae bacterium]
MAVGGYVLYGVVPVSAGDGNALAPNTQLIIMGDVGAVVAQSAFEHVEESEQSVTQFETVVEAVFERQTILPAPFGVVFRNTDHITRWLQMHYLTFTEAIHLVEGRCEVRVHLRTAEGDLATEEPDAAATEMAMEFYNAVSHEADAAVMLRRPALHAVLSSAFLIDRSEWEGFSAIVSTHSRRYASLLMELTGPWPPYDFVRMDLGN